MKANKQYVFRKRFLRRTDGAKDPVVESNREMLLQRSNFGISKYGTTLNDSGLNLREFLHHALEECLDQANYLQAAINKIDKDKLEAAMLAHQMKYGPFPPIIPDLVQTVSVGFKPMKCKLDSKKGVVNENRRTLRKNARTKRGN